jgi:hypothetical protein
LTALVVRNAPNPDGKSFAAARAAPSPLENDGCAVDRADLAAGPLPHCDGMARCQNECVEGSTQRVASKSCLARASTAARIVPGIDVLLARDKELICQTADSDFKNLLLFLSVTIFRCRNK